jgi:hypothetical protein
MRRRRLLGLLRGVAAAAAAWFWASPASADTVSRLVDALDSARSYKVRVQAASLLARLRDPRVGEALSRAAASDPHPTVRMVALKHLARGALADRIPFSVVRPALNRALKDSDAPVRRQAAASLAELDRGAPSLRTTPSTPTPRTGPATVAVGAIGDRTGRASRALREQLRAELRALLRRESRFQLADDISGVNFLIDGTISKLSLSQGGPEVELVCAVELVVSRPPRGIMTIASGEATVQKPRSHYQPSLRERMEAEALQHAVRGAHENVARFLESQ